MQAAMKTPDALPAATVLPAPDPKLLRRIKRAIRRLPRRQREVFRAIRFEDLGYDEVARRFGITVPEVERLFALALLAIMRRLDRKAGRWWER
jgi:RNA polymerase sigma-70 factor (ECF subfamily)